MLCVEIALGFDMFTTRVLSHGLLEPKPVKAYRVRLNFDFLRKSYHIIWRKIRIQ